MHDKDTPDEDCRLISPFSLERSSINGYRIVGGDGSVAIWVYGEDAARLVVKVLNAAHEHCSRKASPSAHRAEGLLRTQYE
jgi:hypothetical protein